MLNRWSPWALRPGSTMRQALQLLNSVTQQIALIVDDNGRLLGTLTDGDCRRALLRGTSLDDPVTSVMNRSPKTVRRQNVGDAQAIMKRLMLRAVPVVDNQDIVVDVLFSDDPHGPAGSKSGSTPALIMAGGRGNRLRPLTDHIPKPLVRVAGEPLIDILLRRLQAQGFTDITLALGYKADDIRSHVVEGDYPGLDFRFIVETEPDGTAGAVRKMDHVDPSRPVLVCNADTVHNADYVGLLSHHHAMKAAATTTVFEHVTEIPFGVVHVRQGLLKSFEEKPLRMDLVSAGINVVTRDAVMSTASSGPVDMPSVHRHLLSEGLHVAAFVIEGYWLDVGTPAALERANTDNGFD